MAGAWHIAEHGSTLGQHGSEQGLILRDEEHELGARITIENGCRTAPFAITCGIYGWMVHTRFFNDQAEAEAQYEAMKNSLDELLEAAEETAEEDGGRKVLFDGITKFVDTYP